MSEWAAQLISPEVAENVGKVWGFGSATKYDPGPWEGELRAVEGAEGGVIARVSTGARIAA